ncbi:GIY-YIG nuclease family protein, partial [Candidatus Peregrinibacteria bacterium]|nr:GIY-YIG nuclease family protein [Candidatus Peregrinibacteria bacterium]
MLSTAKLVNKSLINIIPDIPQTSGIYRMLDAEKHVLYVGKAKNLRKRVQSYFRKNAALSARTRKLLEVTHSLDYTQTDTELEALMLESNLIKELRPKYNILMKDDKSYVYI